MSVIRNLLDFLTWLWKLLSGEIPYKPPFEEEPMPQPQPGIPSVTLTGSALSGVAPGLLQQHLTAPLPTKVRLGRRPPQRTQQFPCLEAHLDLGEMTTPPPTSTNRRAKAAKALAQMYGNDQYGDCVIASYLHRLGVWSANDADAPEPIVATREEALAQYQSICGPGDNGCMITAVLDHGRTSGIIAGGKAYKLDGYVGVNWTNQLTVQVAVYLFGTVCIGINLPQAWTSAAVWDVTSTRIVGGHDVSIIDYDDQGCYIASWGRIYLLTWRALLQKKWVEEAWASLDATWYNSDKLAPVGIKADTLKSDLDLFAKGQLPSIDPDGPPSPPPPPPPSPPPSGTIAIPTLGTYTTGLDATGNPTVILRKS